MNISFGMPSAMSFSKITSSYVTEKAFWKKAPVTKLPALGPEMCAGDRMLAFHVGDPGTTLRKIHHYFDAIKWATLSSI